VCDDVMGDHGAKICGGAQRRTRRGFLHQGSVQGCAWPPDLEERLSRLLAGRTEPFVPDGAVFARMKALAEEKYGSPDWLRRHP
jgi:lipoate-protein ligase A